jgi:hypothetical protein
MPEQQAWRFCVKRVAMFFDGRRTRATAQPAVATKPPVSIFALSHDVAGTPTAK